MPVPVIASGGVGTLDHLVEGVREGHATAVLAASIFHFGTFPIAEAKAHLAAAGVPVRPSGRMPLDARSATALGAALWATIEARRGASPDSSYTAKLLAAGPAGVARKLGEEALEAIIEAVRGDTAALTRESADVLYHLLVLWAAAGLSPDAVAAELTQREGASGIEEKRGRKN